MMTVPRLSKLDVIIVAAIACGILWIEHGHRIFTDAPTRPELAEPAVAGACLDNNENVPYSADCILFMQAGAASGMRWRSAAESAATASPVEPARGQLASPASGPVCPDNDSRPYTANCIRFMSGWYWQATTAESGAAALATAPR